MSTLSYKPGQAAFISDGASADDIFKEYIDAPLAAAQQPALNTGMQLLAFMSALPDAFMASEQRELKRLSRNADSKNDARIERLKLSIERANEIHTTAMQGKTRIDRAIMALSTEENIFHGFVSNTQLQPYEKLTVRIFKDRTTDGNTKAVDSLSGTTDKDGYFRISLGKETNQRKPASSYEVPVGLSQQMSDLLSKVNKEKTNATRSATAQDSKQITVQVEILNADGKQLYLDPNPLVLNEGSAYREYIVDTEARDGGDKSFGAAKPTPAKTPASVEKPIAATGATSRSDKKTTPKDKK
jgi:hypothetical protein